MLLGSGNSYINLGTDVSEQQNQSVKPKEGTGQVQIQNNLFTSISSMLFGLVYMHSQQSEAIPYTHPESLLGTLWQRIIFVVLIAISATIFYFCKRKAKHNQGLNHGSVGGGVFAVSAFYLSLILVYFPILDNL
jgi:hypothetical protein